MHHAPVGVVPRPVQPVGIEIGLVFRLLDRRIRQLDRGALVGMKLAGELLARAPDQAERREHESERREARECRVHHCLLPVSEGDPGRGVACAWPIASAGAVMSTIRIGMSVVTHRPLFGDDSRSGYGMMPQGPFQGVRSQSAQSHNRTRRVMSPAWIMSGGMANVIGNALGNSCVTK